MEGFDIILINNFYALPQFVQKYGVELEGGWTITAAWQAGLTNGANVGEIIGLCINGWASERFGYKKTMIGAVGGCTCTTNHLKLMDTLIVLPAYYDDLCHLYSLLRPEHPDTAGG